MNPANTKQKASFDDWLKELGEMIVQIRKKQNLKQFQLAKLCDVSPSVIAKIENKGQNMRCSTLWKIADVLNQDLKIVFHDKGETFFSKRIQDAESKQSFNFTTTSPNFSYGEQNTAPIEQPKTTCVRSNSVICHE